VVGLSAGASTPDWVVEGVAAWLRALEEPSKRLDAVKSGV
jgi:4-hydroxy-3-methylbut-2-enyl diphosphate reductase